MERLASLVPQEVTAGVATAPGVPVPTTRKRRARPKKTTVPPTTR
jgi:hypothetical protein